MAPPAMEGWTKKRCTNVAAAISTRAPMRSYHRARLKSSHQSRMSSPQAAPPSIP
jgi:hypothetical protein